MLEQAISEFQKLSLSKRGKVQNLFCFLVDHEKKNIIFISMASRNLAYLSCIGLGELKRPYYLAFADQIEPNLNSVSIQS